MGGHVNVPCTSSATCCYAAQMSALKRKKERKSLSTCPNEMNPKPTRNAIFAKLSRENLAPFGLQIFLFRSGENEICLKNVIFTSTVSGPPGCLYNMSRLHTLYLSTFARI